MGTVLETPPDVLQEHFNVNAGGSLVIFQATYHLLKASTKSPKFIPITSGIGSLTAYISAPLGYLAYGVSKAALNYLARKIHFENDWLSACFANSISCMMISKTAISVFST